MKRLLIAVILALIFILTLIFLPAGTKASIHGGYAYGATQGSDNVGELCQPPNLVSQDLVGSNPASPATSNITVR